MRRLLITAISLVSLSATAVFAGEGNGEPFPGPDAAVTTDFGTGHMAGKSQDPFQYHAQDNVTVMQGEPHYLTKAQDPYQYHVADQVLHSPVQGTGAKQQTAAAPVARMPVAQHTVPNSGRHG